MLFEKLQGDAELFIYNAETVSSKLLWEEVKEQFH